MSNSVTILDYGIGNILSVARGFEANGADVNITSNIEGIESAETVSYTHLTLPTSDLV